MSLVELQVREGQGVAHQEHDLKVKSEKGVDYEFRHYQMLYRGVHDWKMVSECDKVAFAASIQAGYILTSPDTMDDELGNLLKSYEFIVKMFPDPTAVMSVRKKVEEIGIIAADKLKKDRVTREDKQILAALAQTASDFSHADAPDINGHTNVLRAIEKGNSEWAKACLQLGAHPNHKSKILTKDGFLGSSVYMKMVTPLQAAIICRDLKIIKLLVAAGAWIADSYDEILTTMKFMEKYVKVDDRAIYQFIYDIAGEFVEPLTEEEKKEINSMKLDSAAKLQESVKRQDAKAANFKTKLQAYRDTWLFECWAAEYPALVLDVEEESDSDEKEIEENA